MVCPVMLLTLIVLPGRPPWGAVAVALDEPRGVVAVDEAATAWRSSSTVSCSWTHKHWSLRGTDPALGAAVGLRLAQERRAVSDPEPGREPVKWAERYCGPQSCRSSRVLGGGEQGLAGAPPSRLARAGVRRAQPGSSRVACSPFAHRRCAYTWTLQHTSVGNMQVRRTRTYTPGPGGTGWWGSNPGTTEVRGKRQRALVQVDASR